MTVRAKHRRIIVHVAFWSAVTLCAAGILAQSTGAMQGELQAQEQARRQLETFLNKPAGAGTGGIKEAKANLPYTVNVSPFSSSVPGGLMVLSRDFKKAASIDKPVKTSAYPYAVFVQNTDGSDPKEALLDLDLVNPLDFSPGNTNLLLFGVAGPQRVERSHDSGVISQLWNYRLTDGLVRRISPPDLFVYGGRYSPDGRKIAFAGAKFNKDTSLDAANSGSLPDTAVFLVNADGSGLRRLRRGNSALCWSPSGKQLAFVCEGVGTTPPYQEIWSVEVATGTSHRILRVTGLSRLRSPDEEDGKRFAPYTFNKLVWLSEKELLAEAAWGPRSVEDNGIVRIDTRGRITGKKQNCFVQPVSEKAFLCSAPGVAPDKKTYQFLVQITRGSKR